MQIISYGLNEQRNWEAMSKGRRYQNYQNVRVRFIMYMWRRRYSLLCVHRLNRKTNTALHVFLLYSLRGTSLHVKGQILGRNPDKSLKSCVPPCYSQSPLLRDFTSPPPLPLSKSGLKLVCNVNIAHGHLKYENSRDYAWDLNEIVRSWIRL